MLENRIISELAGIESAPSIRRTLKIHKVVRMFDNSQAYLNFFELACDDESFCIQKYVTNPEEIRFGHQKTGTDDSHCGFCQDSYQINHIDSFKCRICSLWFHKKCFLFLILI